MQARIELTKHQIRRLAERSETSHDYRLGLFKLLQDLVPFAAACCTKVDPQTRLSTGAVTDEEVEQIHARLYEYEYQRTDFNPYDQLALSPDPVATLNQATHSNLNRSPRYRDVLGPGGFGDELRAALRYDGVCWGFLTLFRHETALTWQFVSRFQ